MVTREQLKKEFDSFARGVANLETMRTELNSLDVTGFESEAKTIRAKLKDINEIPEIRKELSSLKRKIAKRDAEKGVRAKTGVIQAKVLKKKIVKLEKKRTKKLLSREQVKDVKDIPKIEKELKNLRNTFKEHTSAEHVKIDSGVGILVDSRFDDFIVELKAELSQKLRERKKDLGKEMKHELIAKQKSFAERYKKLVKEQHEKYKKRIDSELKSEVKRRFERELDNKLSEERNKIISELIKEDAKRLSSEKKSLSLKLHKHYSKKEKELSDRINLQKKKLKESMTRVKKMNLKNASHQKAFNEYKRKQLTKLAETIAEENKKFIEIEKRKLRDIENLKKRASARVKEQSNLLERRMGALGRTEKKDKEILRSKLRELKEKNSQRSKWIEREKKRLQKFAKLKRADLDKRIAELKTRESKDEKEISGEKEKLKVRFGELKKEFEMLKEAERERHERIVAGEKRKMILEVREKKANLAKDFQNKVESMRKENDARVNRELSEREKLLKKKLDVEYRERMEFAMRSKLAEVEKKKLALEKHIISQAKKIFD